MITLNFIPVLRIEIGYICPALLIRMTKEKLTHLVEQLPEHFSLEDVLDRIILLSKIERGVEQSDKNQTLSTDQVQANLGKWLK